MSRNPNTPCSVCGKMCWPTKNAASGKPHICRECKRQTAAGWYDGPGGGRHGFTSTYRRGCRCGECRAAIAAKGRRLYADRAARDPEWVRSRWKDGRTYVEQVPCGRCSKPITPRSTEPFCKRCRRKLSLTKEARLALYERDNWTCQICFDPVDRSADYVDPWAPSLDHIVPRSMGGDDDPSNLRLAHRWCNTVRGNKEWLTLDDVA